MRPHALRTCQLLPAPRRLCPDPIHPLLYPQLALPCCTIWTMDKIPHQGDVPYCSHTSRKITSASSHQIASGEYGEIWDLAEEDERLDGRREYEQGAHWIFLALLSREHHNLYQNTRIDNPNGRSGDTLNSVFFIESMVFVTKWNSNKAKK